MTNVHTNRSDWTDERVDLLKKLWADGQSCSYIAMELGGVTRNAVIGKVHRLGLGGQHGPRNTANEARRRKAKVARAPRLTGGLRGGSRAQRIVALAEASGVKVAPPVANLPKRLPPEMGPEREAALAEQGRVALLAFEAPNGDTGVPIEELGRLHVDVTKGERRRCRWPFGEAVPYKFCGCDVDPLAPVPYCTPHLVASVRAVRYGRGAFQQIGDDA